MNSDGSFVYDPNGTFVGDDTFTYQAHDGADPSNLATVTIAVTNDAPVANNDSYDISHHTATTLQLRTNDTDFDNDAFDVLIVDAPANGSAVVEADGTVTYTPTGDYLGADSFTYKLDDGFDIGNTATVTLNVKNDAPEITHIVHQFVDEETLLTFTVAANDVDLPTDSQLNYSLVNPIIGMAIDALTGVFTWTPTEAQGPQAYTATIRVTDNGVPALFDEQEVHFTVREVNKNPVGTGDNITVDEGGTSTVLDSSQTSLLANDSDPDLPTNQLFAGNVTRPPLYGTVLLETDGTFIYQHHGAEAPQDSFVYEVRDVFGGVAEATVTVAVNPINDAPVAVQDDYVVAEDTTLTDGASVIANDTDAEGDALTASLDVAPVHGTLVLSSDGTFTYTPNPHFFGSDQFTYSISDGKTLALLT